MNLCAYYEVAPPLSLPLSPSPRLSPPLPTSLRPSPPLSAPLRPSPPLSASLCLSPPLCPFLPHILPLSIVLLNCSAHHYTTMFLCIQVQYVYGMNGGGSSLVCWTLPHLCWSCEEPAHCQVNMTPSGLWAALSAVSVNDMVLTQSCCQ